MCGFSANPVLYINLGTSIIVKTSNSKNVIKIGLEVFNFTGCKTVLFFKEFYNYYRRWDHKIQELYSIYFGRLCHRQELQLTRVSPIGIVNMYHLVPTPESFFCRLVDVNFFLGILVFTSMLVRNCNYQLYL
jgi:hypothetical protein